MFLELLWQLFLSENISCKYSKSFCWDVSLLGATLIYVRELPSQLDQSQLHFVAHGIYQSLHSTCTHCAFLCIRPSSWNNHLLLYILFESDHNILSSYLTVLCELLKDALLSIVIHTYIHKHAH